LVVSSLAGIVLKLPRCGAFRLDFDGGLGGEADETALFLPQVDCAIDSEHVSDLIMKESDIMGVLVEAGASRKAA
jgi:hypothetical protein